MFNMIANVAKSIFTNFGTRKVVTLQPTNMGTTGYNLQNITVSAPYGEFAMPHINTNVLMIPVNNSSKAYAAIGHVQSLPQNTPISLTYGESCKCSDNWAIIWNNTGLHANKLDNTAYLATLISGEWVNYLMLNRIKELENMIAEINSNYITLVAWSKTVQSGSSAGVTQTQLTIPTTLSQDTEYMSNENDLLNDNATVVP